MRNSAFEAIMIALNVFVFILALTVAISLMVQIIRATDASNDILVSHTEGSLYETLSDNDARTYNLSDILKLKQKYDPSNGKYTVIVKDKTGTEKALEDYTVNLTLVATKNFSLTYPTATTLKFKEI